MVRAQTRKSVSVDTRLAPAVASYNFSTATRRVQKKPESYSETA